MFLRYYSPDPGSSVSVSNPTLWGATTCRIWSFLTGEVGLGNTIETRLILRELNFIVQNERSFSNTSIRMPMPLPTWRR